MIENYDNIVFDLGGVIFNIDRDKCVSILEDLGLAGAARLLDLYCQSGDFLALEEGRISAGEFFDILRRDCAKPDVSDAELTDALCSFITSLPVHRLEAIAEVTRYGETRVRVVKHQPYYVPHGNRPDVSGGRLVCARLFRRNDPVVSRKSMQAGACNI